MLTDFINISRSTKNLYAKTNMVHILYQIKATSLQPLESFKDMMTAEEYSKCKSNPMHGKSW
jgi:hypothetical protein